MTIFKTTGLLLLLTLLTWHGASAQQYPGYYPWGYPSMQPPPGGTAPQFRPQEQPRQQENNRRGSPSGNGQPAWPQVQPQVQYSYPQQSPYAYQQQQPAASYQPPQIEASISETRAYEQQSLIYKIRIISSGNLSTASPELPRNDSLVLRPLADPISFTQTQGNEQKVITEHTYILMPLRAGTINIPPARVTGTYTSPGSAEGPEFNAVAQEHLVLQVKPAIAEILPWQPLHDLQVRLKLEDTTAPSVDKPFKLEIELTAVGATGNQLPSIASMLSDELFRIYPDRSSVSGTVSADGRALIGNRTERFTLIPRYGGLLEIPSPVINWWNVDLDTQSQARGPLQRIQVQGPPRPEKEMSSSGADSGLANWFWLPLLLVAAFVLYNWIHAFIGPGRSGVASWVGATGKALLGELFTPLARAWAEISPRRYLHHLRTAIGRNLPISWKLWYCLRAVSQEEDPENWAHALQILTSKHLGIRRHSSLEALGKEIVTCHPKADAATVEKLMHELDGEVYGHQRIDSFPRWKAEFQAQIKPRLLSLKVHNCEPDLSKQQKLPSLNPR